LGVFHHNNTCEPHNAFLQMQVFPSLNGGLADMKRRPVIGYNPVITFKKKMIVSLSQSADAVSVMRSRKKPIIIGIA
jgi:hypothetical protein